MPVAPPSPSRPADPGSPVALNAASFKSRPGLGRLAAALRYSWAGLRYAWRHEAAFRQELAVCLALLPVALGVPLPPIERILLVGSLLLLLIVELLNSAIEAVVDRVGLEPHPLAKQAKDLGSAAVFMTLILAVVVWVGLLAPGLLALARGAA